MSEGSSNPNVNDDLNITKPSTSSPNKISVSGNSSKVNPQGQGQGQGLSSRRPQVSLRLSVTSNTSSSHNLQVSSFPSYEPSTPGAPTAPPNTPAPLNPPSPSNQNSVNTISSSPGGSGSFHLRTPTANSSNSSLLIFPSSSPKNNNGSNNNSDFPSLKARTHILVGGASNNNGSSTNNHHTHTANLINTINNHNNTGSSSGHSPSQPSSPLAGSPHIVNDNLTMIDLLLLIREWLNESVELYFSEKKNSLNNAFLEKTKNLISLFIKQNQTNGQSHSNSYAALNSSNSTNPSPLPSVNQNKFFTVYLEQLQTFLTQINNNDNNIIINPWLFHMCILGLLVSGEDPEVYKMFHNFSLSNHFSELIHFTLDYLNFKFSNQNNSASLSNLQSIFNQYITANGVEHITLFTDPLIKELEPILISKESANEINKNILDPFMSLVQEKFCLFEPPPLHSKNFIFSFLFSNELNLCFTSYKLQTRSPDSLRKSLSNPSLEALTTNLSHSTNSDDRDRDPSADESDEDDEDDNRMISLSEILSTPVYRESFAEYLSKEKPLELNLLEFVRNTRKFKKKFARADINAAKEIAGGIIREFVSKSGKKYLSEIDSASLVLVEEKWKNLSNYLALRQNSSLEFEIFDTLINAAMHTLRHGSYQTFIRSSSYQTMKNKAKNEKRSSQTISSLGQSVHSIQVSGLTMLRSSEIRFSAAAEADEEEESEAVTLERIMVTPTYLTIFKKHMDEENHGDNLRFLIGVGNFRDHYTPTTAASSSIYDANMHARAQQIYSTYFLPTSVPNPLSPLSSSPNLFTSSSVSVGNNIPISIRESIESALYQQRVTFDIFDKAYACIFLIVKTGAYTRFTTTELYRQMIALNPTVSIVNDSVEQNNISIQLNNMEQASAPLSATASGNDPSPISITVSGDNDNKLNNASDSPSPANVDTVSPLPTAVRPAGSIKPFDISNVKRGSLFSPLFKGLNDENASDNETLSAKNVNLARILATPRFRAALANFMDTEHAIENLSFLKAVMTYVKMASAPNEYEQPLLLQTARAIYHDFISPSAPDSVNLDLPAISAIGAVIKSNTNNNSHNKLPLDRHLFDHAYAIVFSCVKHGAYHRFIQSKIFQNLLVKEGEREKARSAKPEKEKKKKKNSGENEADFTDNKHGSSESEDDTDPKIPLRTLLIDPRYSDTFRLFASNLHCSENVSFLNAVHTFRSIASRGNTLSTLQNARAIVEQYVDTNAADCVNVDVVIKDTILSKIEKAVTAKANSLESTLSVDLFDAAYTLVKRNVHSAVYEPFCESNEYRDMIRSTRKAQKRLSTFSNAGRPVSPAFNNLGDVSPNPSSTHTPNSHNNSSSSNLNVNTSLSTNLFNNAQSTVPLSTILATPSFRSVLYAFMEREHSEDNLDFLLRVESYRNLARTNEESSTLTDRQASIETAQDIYDTYISENAHDSMNLDKHLVHDITLSMASNQYPSTLFDNAYRKVVNFIASDTYHRFVGSDDFRRMILRHRGKSYIAGTNPPPGGLLNSNLGNSDLDSDDEDDNNAGLGGQVLSPISQEAQEEIDLTLDDVIASPFLFAELRSFMETEHSDENLLFVQSVIQYRTLFVPQSPRSSNNFDPVAKLNAAREIVTRFISDSAKTPINVSEKVRGDILDIFKAIDESTNSAGVQLNLFDAAEAEVKSLIRGGSLSRFLELREEKIKSKQLSAGNTSIFGNSDISPTRKRPSSATARAAQLFTNLFRKKDSISGSGAMSPNSASLPPRSGRTGSAIATNTTPHGKITALHTRTHSAVLNLSETDSSNPPKSPTNKAQNPVASPRSHSFINTNNNTRSRSFINTNSSSPSSIIITPSPDKFNKSSGSHPSYLSSTPAPINTNHGHNPNQSQLSTPSLSTPAPSPTSSGPLSSPLASPLTIAPPPTPISGPTGYSLGPIMMSPTSEGNIALQQHYLTRPSFSTEFHLDTNNLQPRVSIGSTVGNLSPLTPLTPSSPSGGVGFSPPVSPTMRSALVEELTLAQEQDLSNATALTNPPEETSGMSPRTHSRSTSINTSLIVNTFLSSSYTFLKHGRAGKPHKRTLTVSKPTPPSLISKISWNGGDRKVDLEKVEIIRGKITKVFQRNTAVSASDSVCFSLVWDNNSLDLQANSNEEREQFITFWTAFRLEALRENAALQSNSK